MPGLASALYRVAITLWVGGLWVVGYVAAPILFSRLADRALAGSLAGAMFTAFSWVGIGCAAYVLLFLCLRAGMRALSGAAFWIALAMLLLTLASLFGIQPIIVRLAAESWPRAVVESVARDRFAMWHGIASVLYVIQSLLGLALVLVSDKH